MEIVKITSHVIYDKGTISNSDNISAVIDKMIRLAAKLTEYYASDIVYDIENLKDAVENGKEHDVLLFFRESGVTTRETETFNAEEYSVLLFNFTPIQVWRLTHDPASMKTKLLRVNVRTEYAITEI